MTPRPILARLAGLLLLAVLLSPAVAVVVYAASTHGETAVQSEEPGPAGGPGVFGLEEGIEAAEHGGGLPQLDALTFPSQIFWLIVSFATLYWLLSRKALPRVSDILEARQTRISSDLDQAAALRNEAEEALRRHQAVVAEAQARAAAQIKETQDRLSAEAAKRQADIDAELNAKLAEAEGRIASAKNQALAEIQGVAAEVARSAVHRLAGIEVDAKDVEAAVGRIVREAA
jgi:F-type H+-transporting ATPase subunit b